MEKVTDYQLAKIYLNKVKDAQQRNIEFALSLSTVRTLINTKYCYFTGIELTPRRKDKLARFTDRTIDRIDSSLGYVGGNCVAACYGVNQWKSTMECSDSPLNYDLGLKILLKTKKRAKFNQKIIEKSIDFSI